MPDNPESDFPKQIHGNHYRGYLPHEKILNACYFVTFRLADSLPRQALEKLNRELETLKRELPAEISAQDREMRAKLHRHREIEKLLDQGSGKCWLRRPDIADLVASAVTHFNGERYDLKSWVVMPNHVHALVTPRQGNALGSIIKSWKQFTSLRAKRLLALSEEAFWQPESYDHWTRDAGERERIISYIHHNPVKARLCEYAWEWCWSSCFNKQPGIL